MSDVAESLRRHVATYRTITRHRQDCLDAADEIERLRGLLREARLNFEHGFIDEEDSRQFVMRLNAELAETTGGSGDDG